ncbi:sensor histidine kinase [Phenylobacterium sp.]|uniref:sensor histidine kinase n=1 Tax=Phenylobacterium sp. TaxID=1871053 RepID=UPI002720FD39|nr:HWE histidine kinase domain-containing protein [Phenylobacterium sp.]MDO8801063.1 PAS domain-containing protein [Phenylobacterium sp.]
MQKIDFEALFDTLPSPYMVLDRELRYVEINQAYAATVARARQDLIGRHIFEAFPDNGESGRLLRASFQRVIDTGQPDTMALIGYAIERPASQGGGMEMRYWSAVHTPLFGDDGGVAFVVQNTVDVTELQTLKQMASGEAPAPIETSLLQRVQEVQRANLSLLQETSELRDIFRQAPGFMAVLTGSDLTFTLANDAYQQLIGHRPVIGRPVDQALPEVRSQGFVSLLESVMATREPFIGRAASVVLQRTPQGPPEERFVDFIYQPILGPDGETAGVFVEGSDVTDRVRAEEQQKLLLDELNHRVKNTLATVQSIAAQTLRTSPDPTEFRHAFESRLMALSSTHDLLTASSWRGADLRDILQAEFRPHGVERYKLDGPDLGLSPARALALGLLFHELATNAAKYGALSSPEGCVKVRWSVEDVDGDHRLVIGWTEEKGPKVGPPTRKGFGSRLIERSLKGELRGEATLDYLEDGLRCRVVLPLD